MSNVEQMSDGHWTWVHPKGVDISDVTGKYLFFSPDRKRLLEIAQAEVGHHDFPLAKVNQALLGGQGEYVLCLYYRDNSRRYELRDRWRAQYEDVKYRWWKTNAATVAREYSPEFVARLSEEDKHRFGLGR